MGVVGLTENKANSAQLELEAGAELGNKKATSKQLGFDLIVISLVFSEYDILQLIRRLFYQ